MLGAKTGGGRSRAYRADRQQLLAAGFPGAMLVIFGSCLIYEFIDLLNHPAIFRAELAPNLLQLIVPLLAFALVRGPLRSRAEAVAVGADLTFTVVLAARLFLPTTTVSGIALFLSLKMVATALLFPWMAAFQYASVCVTLLLYWCGIAASGHSLRLLHEILGPLIAGLISAVGASRADRVRRDLFLRSARLTESEGRLRTMLDGERALVATALEISVLSELPKLLARINERTAAALGCDFSTTLLLDQVHRQLVGASTYSEPGLTPAADLPFRASVDTPLARELLNGRTVVINDPGPQQWLPPKMLARYGIQSIAFAPIMAKRQVLGVLTAGRVGRPEAFDERQLSLLEGVAAQAAVAIENARLFERLSSSEARYRDLFERANDLVFVVDERGPFRFANQAALNLFRVRPADLELARWEQFVTSKSQRDIARRLAVGRHRGLESGHPFEVEVRVPEGTAAIELRARLVSAPGQPRLYQCIGRDVTERRRQERETQGLLNRLRESNRLQTEFVANMSHELRTPLNVIIGYADLLADEPILPPRSDARAFLDRIGSAARALHRLVESVLEYARLDRGRTALIPTRFSADFLLLELQALCNDVRSSFEVTLHVSGAPDLELSTDYDRLYSVLSNLLLNAFKFTPRGEVHLIARRSGHYADFYVRDTGIGIAPDEVARVFEAFRQIDGSPTRNFGGVGLGLAIVRRNVELLGGTVQVESRVGGGSTFRVRIPMHLETEAERRVAFSAA
jgi:PAS domain S-box-containing protein